MYIRMAQPSRSTSKNRISEPFSDSSASLMFDAVRVEGVAVGAIGAEKATVSAMAWSKEILTQAA